MEPYYLLIIIGLIVLSLSTVLSYFIFIKKTNLFKHDHITNPFLISGVLANIFWASEHLDLNIAVLISHAFLSCAMFIIMVLLIYKSSKMHKIIQYIIYSILTATAITIAALFPKHNAIQILGGVFQAIYSFHSIIKAGLHISMYHNEPQGAWEPLISLVGSLLVVAGAILRKSLIYEITWSLLLESTLATSIILSTYRLNALYIATKFGAPLSDALKPSAIKCQSDGEVSLDSKEIAEKGSIHNSNILHLGS
jgi:hypothetical protein